MPVLADAMTSLIRNPEIGISGNPTTSIANRARLTVMPLMAMLRNTGVRSETVSSEVFASPSII